MSYHDMATGAPSFDQPKDNNLSMIVVVGVTGSGKSYFINRLAGRKVVDEGGQLNSCTQQCQMIPVEIGNTKTLLIDTPGFDDTNRPEADILNEIADVLTAQYALGFKLQGVIYVHRITDVRYSGTNVKTFEIVKRICGDEALANVLLITSRWDEVDEATGADRERQLRDSFWAYMLGHGSRMSRFYGDHTSAVSLASQLLIRGSVVLRLQREIIDERKPLNMTAAGAFVDSNLVKTREEYRKEMQDLHRAREELRETDRATRRRWEADWANEQTKLQSVEEQQTRLRRDVADEVRGKMEEEKKSRSKYRGLKKLIPLITVPLSIFGLFVGIPPGTFELLATFFEGESE